MMVEVRVLTRSAHAAAEGFEQLMKSGAYNAVLSSEPDRKDGWPKKVFSIRAIVDHEAPALTFLKNQDFEDENL